MSSQNMIDVRMRRLSAKELGPFRLDLVSMLASSSDPFAFLKYSFDIGPCKQLAKKITAESAKKITLTHVLNKILALAIDENPLFNQVVLGNNIYQMEDVHISNVYLIPGTECAITCILLTNPHRMSLVEIQQELSHRQEIKAHELLQKPRNPVKDAMSRFVYRHNLLRFVGEKLVFTVALKKGLFSNIVFLNQIYGRPATFQVIKPVITPLKVSLRVQAHGPQPTTYIENGAVKSREMIPLHIAVDHRVLHGIHAHRFGESLERIAAEPGKYL